MILLSLRNHLSHYKLLCFPRGPLTAPWEGLGGAELLNRVVLWGSGQSMSNDQPTVKYTKGQLVKEENISPLNIHIKHVKSVNKQSLI